MDHNNRTAERDHRNHNSINNQVLDLTAPITGERYYRCRLQPLLARYTYESRRLVKFRGVVQFTLIIFGAVGSTLAYLRQAIWIPVSISFITFCSAFLDMLGPLRLLHRINHCVQTLTDLEVRWIEMQREFRHRCNEDMKNTMIVETEKVVHLVEQANTLAISSTAKVATSITKQKQGIAKNEQAPP